MMRLRLSPIGRYIFRELLDQCYIDGSLEDDEVLLAKLTDVSLKEFRAVWPEIQKAFERRDDGKWHHAKADDVLGKLCKYREQRSEAGKRSGKSRSSKAEHPFNGRSTYVEPSTSSTSTTSSTTSNVQADDAFDDIYKRHPKKQNRHLAEQYFAGAITDGVTPQAIAERHAKWCASNEWTQSEGRFAPTLDAWLARKGWRDDAPPAPFDPGF